MVNPAARRVMLRLDASGTVYDFKEIRRALDDTTVSPQQSEITLDPVRALAVIQNSGGGLPTTFYRASGPDLITARSLGVPAEMIARIVRECGKRE